MFYYSFFFVVYFEFFCYFSNLYFLIVFCLFMIKLILYLFQIEFDLISFLSLVFLTRAQGLLKKKVNYTNDLSTINI